jgi:cold shock CspA family protein
LFLLVKQNWLRFNVCIKQTQQDVDMLHQGRLKSWDVKKGRGLIQQTKAGPDIPLSSSGFRKTPELLQDGDIIFFQIEVDDQARPRAVQAYKAGQSFAPAPLVNRPKLSSLLFQQLLSAIVCLSILGWLSYQLWYLLGPAAEPVISELSAPEILLEQTRLSDEAVWPQLQKPQQQGTEWQCEGKIRCTEMRSCEEAMFYLNNCPDVTIDGDGDGIPCEQQWCTKPAY